MFKWIVLCCWLVASCFAQEEVYSHIKDIYHPTLDDYKRVQEFMRERRDIDDLIITAIYIAISNNFKMVGEGPDKGPQEGICHVNGGGENCVILYASYNKSYINGLNWLVNSISKSDFKGDILYKIGGWPDLEGGSFVLSHVPYAFKVCFFKEAARLGYKRVLWLDTAIIPLVSLNTIFQQIEKEHFFILGNDHMVGPHFMNDESAAYFGLTLEETEEIPSCSASILGVDFTHPRAVELIDRWYEAAKDPYAFFNPRCDQSALSLILHQMGITEWVSFDRIPHHEDNIRPDSLFLADKAFVHAE